MSPLQSDRFRDLRDVARVLGGERRSPVDGGRVPAPPGATLRRGLVLAVLAVAIPFAWRVSTPCGLRPCAPRIDAREATRAPAVPAPVAVAEAPRDATIAVAQAPRAEPAAAPAAENDPSTDTVPRVAASSIESLLAAEREVGSEPSAARAAASPPLAAARPARKAAPAPRKPSAASTTAHGAAKRAPARSIAPAAPAVAAAAAPDIAPAAEAPDIAPADAPDIAPAKSEAPAAIRAAREIVPATPRAAPTPDAAMARNLSGRWLVTNAIDATDYRAFSGLRIRFRVHLVQRGESLSGYGEKFTVNDEPLPSSQRSPIELAGTVRGRDVLVRFLERGARRVSSGGFRWRLSEDGRTLQGTFDSTAAGTHGRSHASREG